jgi:hypothetical protein
LYQSNVLIHRLLLIHKKKNRKFVSDKKWQSFGFGQRSDNIQLHPSIFSKTEMRRILQMRDK